MKLFFRKLYNLIPIKKEIFVLIRAVWIPPKNIIRHLHFKGAFKVKASESKTFRIQHHGYVIENELFWHGVNNGWEKISLTLWIELCKTSNTIFDIGANTGIYSLVAKSINPQAKVYAFEPILRIFKKLDFNCKLNKFDILAEPCAISCIDGHADIYDTMEEHVLSVSLNKDFDAHQNLIPVKIPIKKLDSIIEANNIPRIDLLKIDVETHEPEVLEGYKKYLAIHKPTILIEILNNAIAQKIEEALYSLDYLYFNIDEINPPKQVSRLTKSDHYNFLICDKQTAINLKLI
jgi:FkbM family methyltransferase